MLNCQINVMYTSQKNKKIQLEIATFFQITKLTHLSENLRNNYNKVCG